MPVKDAFRGYFKGRLHPITAHFKKYLFKKPLKSTCCCFGAKFSCFGILLLTERLHVRKRGKN